MKVDYFKIIHKYIKPNSLTYCLYMPHVILVTNKALKAAKKLKLTKNQIQFIEVAGMLHDIGIVRIDDPLLGCTGKLPYIQHLTEGKKILTKEGLPKHALVCEKHTTITKQQVINRSLDIEPRDYTPKTIEQEIIAWADKFYSKNFEKLWDKKTVKQISKMRKSYGMDAYNLFNSWDKKFGN